MYSIFSCTVDVKDSVSSHQALRDLKRKSHQLVEHSIHVSIQQAKLSTLFSLNHSTAACESLHHL